MITTSFSQLIRKFWRTASACSPWKACELKKLYQMKLPGEWNACNRTSRSRRRDLDVFGRSSKIEGQPIHKMSVNFSFDTVSTKKSVVEDEKKCWASFLSVAFGTRNVEGLESIFLVTRMVSPQHDSSSTTLSQPWQSLTS